MKVILAIVCSFFLYIVTNAQPLGTYVHSAEYGISVGAAQYFGDLNPDVSLSHSKIAAGIFYQKQVNNYTGIRITGTYAQLGYSDKYSKNAAQRTRNLSFNTDLWEINLGGYFNFFKFDPQLPRHHFTPYISLAAGVFSFNPYAYLQGQKIYLQPLRTEGQGSSADVTAARRPYKTIAASVPIGVGIKYAFNKKMNVFAEVTYRFTTTKYLDDVSGEYHPNAYPQTNAAGNYTTWYSMQDRSYEILGKGNQIGVQGFQRGNNTPDSYATFQVGISFNIQSYRCAQP